MSTVEPAGSRSRRWLVTGGAGFFGVHMCRGLRLRGEVVISYDRVAMPPEERVDGVSEVVADMRDEDRLVQALDGVDYVVHAAAALALAPAAEVDAVNRGGTETALRACRRAGVKRLVHVSTTAVYGMPKTHPITETHALHPMGVYGVAKAKAERACLEADGVEAVVIRPKSFIGTGRLGIFQILFDWIESGRRIYVLGDGNNRFQLLEVEDLVDAVHAAAVSGRSHEVYNIGARDFGTVNEDVGALLAYAGTGSRIVHVPARPAKLALGALECLRLSPIYRWVWDTADQDSYVSIEKAQRELGWTPRYSNREALIRTYDWYLREGKVLAQVTGTSHRVAWKQGVLKVLKALS